MIFEVEIFEEQNTLLFYICNMIVQLPLFISGGEIAFIVFILVMVFGADKIPEIARGLGKGMRQVKDATNDIKREITKSRAMRKKPNDNV